MEQVTHLEVVLGDWQQLPDSLLALSDDWKYVPGGIYTIVHTDISRALSSEEEALFVRLQGQNVIVAGSSRTRTLPTSTVNKRGLPDWAEP